jgi:hypothetical protein
VNHYAMSTTLTASITSTQLISCRQRKFQKLDISLHPLLACLATVTPFLRP